MRELVFIDVETTGLDPERHEVWECAAAIVVPKQWGRMVIPKEWDAEQVRSWQMQLDCPSTATEEALRVADFYCRRRHFLDNGGQFVSRRLWLRELGEMIQGRRVVGHNVSFDLAFLRAEARRAGVELPHVGGHIDTMTMAWFRLAPEGLRSLSLRNVCQVLCIDNAGAHSAEVDVRRTIKVLTRLYMPDWTNRQDWRGRIERMDRERKARLEGSP